MCATGAVFDDWGCTAPDRDGTAPSQPISASPDAPPFGLLSTSISSSAPPPLAAPALDAPICVPELALLPVPAIAAPVAPLPSVIALVDGASAVSTEGSFGESSRVFFAGGAVCEVLLLAVLARGRLVGAPAST